MISKGAVFFYKGVKWVCSKLFTGGKSLFKAILVPIKFINKIYFSLFTFLLVKLKALGIVGELLFTIFGLVYLLWPLGLAYYFGKIEIYIPAVILTVILIIQGRSYIVKYG